MALTVCLDCGVDFRATPGPRGGLPDRCPRCTAERAAPAKPAPRPSKPVRICARCSRPATSSRHWLCDVCAGRTRPTRTPRAPQPKLSRQRRGYTSTHDALRRRWAAAVRRGGVHCGYCGAQISPGDPWDLGHPNDDKSQAPAPWHQACNRSFAARVTRRRRQAQRRVR